MFRNTLRLFNYLSRVAEDIDTPGIIKSVQRHRMTYLDGAALRWLAQQVHEIDRDRVPGLIVEAGCALGGSSIVIAKSKNPGRQLCVYDVFGQIPPPSARDGADVHARYAVIVSGKSPGIDGDRYYGYEHDLQATVRDNFEALGVPPEKYNVNFIQGLYQDTLHPNDSVAFAHLDCDWYDSVTVCLQRIVPLLSPGGRIVMDDYFAYSGCRAAVWDYFRPRLDAYKFIHGPRLLIVFRKH